MRLEARVEGRRFGVEVSRGSSGYRVTLDGQPMEVDLVPVGERSFSLLVDGRSHDVGLEEVEGGYRVLLRGGAVGVALAPADRAGTASGSPAKGPARLLAPMPGRVVRILAEKGNEVASGQGLVVIEAMKMENELKAPRQGRVDEVAVREGQAVEAGALLLVVT